MERRQKIFYEYLGGGTPGTKNWLFVKYQKKLWKMMKISQINKIGWNLVTFKVIDRVLVDVSLIDSKNSWVSLIDLWELLTTLATNYRRPLISPPFHIKRLVSLISFERGESKDYANIKIFKIKCQMVVYQTKQDRLLHSCR